MIVALLAVAVLFVGSKDARADDYIVAYGEDSYPYQFTNTEGDADGLLIDLWREWAAIQGHQLTFIGHPWSDSIDFVAKGNVDFHAGFSPTPKRAEIFEFSSPITRLNTYLHLHHSLPQHESISELTPYRIGIVKDSAHKSKLNEINPRLEFAEYKTRAALLDAALQGDIKIFASMDGFLKDQAIELELLQSYPRAKRIRIASYPMTAAVVKSKKHLLAGVENGFSEIDGSLRRDIRRKWLGMRNQTLTLMADSDNAPFMFRDNAGRFRGLYIDIWQLWSSITGIPVSFAEGDSNQQLDWVKDGRVDGHAGYPAGGALNTGLHSIWPIYQQKVRLFYPFDRQAPSVNSEAQRVGVLANAPYMDQIRLSYPLMELILFADLNEMEQALKAGRLVGMFASAPQITERMIREDNWGYYQSLDAPEYRAPYYVLSRESDTALNRRIQAGFESIRVPQLHNIEKRWLVNSRDYQFAKDAARLELNESEQALVAEFEELTVGYLNNWPPMEFTDGVGQFAGINSAIVRHLSEQLGFSVNAIAYNDFQTLMKAVADNQVDLVASVQPSAQRRANLLFSDAYWPAPYGLATRSDKVDIVNLTELKSQRIAVIEGYAVVNKLRNLDMPMELVLVNDTAQGLAALAHNDVDVFIDQMVSLASQLRRDPQSEVRLSLLADYSSEHSHLALNSRLEPLLPLINRGLATLTSNDKHQMYHQWQIPEAQPDSSAGWWVKWSLLVGLIVVGFSGMTWLTNNKLKREVTRRAMIEKRIQHVASHDNLTQLPNRSLFHDRVTQALLTHAREKQKFALMFLDVDGFKKINDKWGHSAGDVVLKEIGRRLVAAVRQSDTVSRFGGDEFVVLLNRIKDTDGVVQVADSLIDAVVTPFQVENEPVQLGVSIGIALYPKHSDELNELLKIADANMYAAKRNGGNQYRL